MTHTVMTAEWVGAHGEIFATAVACCGEFGDTIFVSQNQNAVLKTPQKTEGRGQCFPLLRQRCARLTSVLFPVEARSVRTPG